MEMNEQFTRALDLMEHTWLKAQDVKSRRVIIPHEVGEMEYMNKTYTGVKAHCCTRKEERVFRVDQILEISVAA